MKEPWVPMVVFFHQSTSVNFHLNELPRSTSRSRPLTVFMLGTWVPWWPEGSQGDHPPKIFTKVQFPPKKGTRIQKGNETKNLPTHIFQGWFVSFWQIYLSKVQQIHQLPNDQAFFFWESVWVWVSLTNSPHLKYVDVGSYGSWKKSFAHRLQFCEFVTFLGWWMSEFTWPELKGCKRDLQLGDQKVTAWIAWATKNRPTFHYTGWLIGILTMVYYNPYITG